METDRDPFWHFERAGWNKAAENYQARWTDLTIQFIEPLLSTLAVTPGSRLLDVACGPGFVSEAAHRLGVHTVGLDFSSEMVRQATKRNPPLDFREGDAQSLPFEQDTFDSVTINFGVPHLAQPGQAFAEACRVLRSDGRFAFTVWAEPHENPGVKIMNEAIEAHADMNVDLPEGPPTSDSVTSRNVNACLRKPDSIPRP